MDILHWLHLGRLINWGVDQAGLLGICFLRGALEGAVEGIGDGEKGGYSAARFRFTVNSSQCGAKETV